MNWEDSQCGDLNKGDGNQADDMVWNKHATRGNHFGEKKNNQSRDIRGVICESWKMKKGKKYQMERGDALFF